MPSDLCLSDLPRRGVNVYRAHLRIIKALRVIRLFRRLKDANRIVTALLYGVIPVTNAFIILFVVTAIYAVLGTHIFGVQSPEYFGTFLTSLFTMMQVVTGDSWSSAVTRSLFPPGEPNHSITFFFVSYILIGGTVLLNVVLTGAGRVTTDASNACALQRGATERVLRAAAQFCSTSSSRPSPPRRRCNGWRWWRSSRPAGSEACSIH